MVWWWQEMQLDFSRKPGAASRSRATLLFSEIRGSAIPPLAGGGISSRRGPLPRVAPYCSRIWIFARSPAYMAQSSGDSPSVVRTFGSAPCSSSSLSMPASSASELTAVSSGVLPYWAALLAFTSAPDSIQRATNAAGCQEAAVINRSGIGRSPFDTKYSVVGRS